MNTSFEIASFNEKIPINRVLGSVSGTKNAPTVIAIAGIHGNERAGINALYKVFNALKNDEIQLKGNFYGIAGNISAIAKNNRFHKEDLNRIWTKEKILKLHLESDFADESYEQKEIYNIIKEILKKEKGPFFFLDLHTTSADTEPFITISDSLNNRSFSSNFSVPVILGIEEFLEGPLLTYINEFGHVALGFEAGQHYKQVSVNNCEAFIWLALVASKCLKKKHVKKYDFYKNFLNKKTKKQEFYEIKYKHTIQPNEDFKMGAGFQNFQQVLKNDLLAYSNNHTIVAPFSGTIFMPLYQSKGEDGFFIIQKISKFWLQFSSLLRKLYFHHLLRILPGVKDSKKNSYTLIVNLKTTKFLATEIFHLFGYRKKIIDKNKMYFLKRDRKVSDFL